MTYVIVWRFRAQPARADEFVRAYASDGDWARFFEGGEGFLGTELIEIAGGECLTIDRWVSRAHHERFRDENASEYEAMDQRFEDLCAHEERLGEGESR